MLRGMWRAADSIGRLTMCAAVLWLTTGASPALAGSNPCPADCADDSGEVDVSDLLELLAQWGGPGSCDIDGSGTIDVSDLLTLLGEWGPCPVVNTGACCLPDETCTPDVDIDECAALNGTYVGDGTECDEDACSCLDNDECICKFTIDNNPDGHDVTAKAINAATVSEPPALCTIIYGDLWYEYIVLGGGLVTIQTDFNIFLEIHITPKDECFGEIIECVPGQLGATLPLLEAGDVLTIRLIRDLPVPVGGGKLFINEIDPTGACCLDGSNAGGSCLDDVTSSDCQAQGGEFQGVNSTCAEVECGAVGACCIGALTEGIEECVEVDAFSCLNEFGGTYFGDGTSCLDGHCMGACCYEDVKGGGGSTCDDDTTPYECEVILGGEFQGYETTCQDVLCGIGACCIDCIAGAGKGGKGEPSCIEVTAKECQSFGGFFLGDGSVCGVDECFEGPDNDRCEDSTEAVLGDNDVVFDGAESEDPLGCFGFFAPDVFFTFTPEADGSYVVSYCANDDENGIEVWEGCACPASQNTLIDCDSGNVKDNDCLVGARSELVVEMTAGTCYTIVIGQSCGYGSGTLSISVAGACCLPFEGTSCFDSMSSYDCAAQGGVYYGDGSTCQEVDCQEGACCFIDGTEGVGDCEITDIGTCGDIGGEFLGEGSTCDECVPAFGACCFFPPASGDLVCDVMASVSCEGIGGVYHGDGTTCADVNCSSIGACCLDGFCQDGVTELDCLDSGGFWLGPDSTCGDTDGCL